MREIFLSGPGMRGRPLLSPTSLLYWVGRILFIRIVPRRVFVKRGHRIRDG